MNNEPHRLGKIMIYAAWIAGLGLLTLFFNHFLEKQYNPNRNVSVQENSEGVREIRLQRNRSGHYVANGLINGEPVTFLLDTGATIVSVPESIAKQLGLEYGATLRMVTANGEIQTYGTRIDRISVGAIELRNVLASINPQMTANQEILLGMSFLKKLEWVQQGDTLILRQLLTQ